MADAQAARQQAAGPGQVRAGGRAGRTGGAVRGAVPGTQCELFAELSVSCAEIFFVTSTDPSGPAAAQEAELLQGTQTHKTHKTN